MAGTLAWERVGNQFFRTLEGPTMRWDLDIAHVQVRGAPGGGVIAAWDKENAIVRRDASVSAASPTLRLFSSEGNQIGQIKLDFGEVVDVQIRSDESIIIVTRSGLARHYTEFGKNFVQLHLPYSTQSVELSDDGYTVLLDSPEHRPSVVRFTSVTKCSTPEPRYRIISTDVGPEFHLSNWCLVPAKPDIGQAPGVLLIDDKGSAHLYDSELSGRSHRRVAEQIPSGIIAISPDATCIAFSDGRSRVSVYPVDFHEQLLNINIDTKHESMSWVGKDALALLKTDGEADIFSLRGSSDTRPLTTYFDDNEVTFIPEIDGVRVLGNNNHSILAPVMRPTSDTFKLGSLAPSSILYSCVDQIDAGSPRSDQTIKLLDQRQLTGAVDTCISAALLELDAKTQRRLMRAASFGKSMLEAYDSTRYLDALTKLRILNALRSLTPNPLFITNDQLKALGISALLHRLELRGLWAEAVSIAKLERVPIEPVYIEWACWVIQNREQDSDENVYAEISEKLDKLEAYSHSKMALRALEQGRQKLALSLLESEPVAKDRVVLLLEMNMAQPALEQAIKSGNLFLVDYVLIVLAEKLSFPQLMRILGGNDLAISRQIELFSTLPHSQEKLHDFLHQMDQRSKSLEIEFGDVCSENDLSIKTRMLHALENKFGALGKKSLPESQVCAEWADLLSLQKQLETTYNIDVAGKSASDTVTTLLKLPQLSQAQKIRTKLGINDRQFWWLRVRALVDRRDFDGLWDLAHSKKSPIGYQPFFDACFDAGNLEHAARFVDLVSDASIEDKVRMFMRVKHLEQAKELAIRSRNSQLISLVNA